MLGQTLDRICAVALLCAGTSSAAVADTFGGVRYDGRTDELVITMHYRGTNPDHDFTVNWGACKDPGPGSTLRQISATVLDSQWNDAARASFDKTIRVSLAAAPCRPAHVTLRTAPRFYVAVDIPARTS